LEARKCVLALSSDFCGMPACGYSMPYESTGISLTKDKVHASNNAFKNITVEHNVYFMSSTYNNKTIQIFTLSQISLICFESSLAHLQGPTFRMNLIKGDYLYSYYLVAFYLHKIYMIFYFNITDCIQI
jgi:hypothetical protein